MTVVIDSSAIPAFVFEESGDKVAFGHARHAFPSAVNLDEVLHKALRRGVASSDILTQLDRLQIEIVPFNRDDARPTAPLQAPLHRLKIAVGDRVRIALPLALDRHLPLVTADTDWLKLDFGLDIGLIH